MTDLELIGVVVPYIEAAIASKNWAYLVVQKDQPTQQGIPTEGTVFFELLFSREYGHPAAKSKYTADTNTFDETVGSWEDQEIVQGIVEPAGTALEYGDMTNIPLSSWNVNFERRTIVRGEMGIQVGLLEEGRASAMRINSAEQKRQGAAVQLEIMRNAIGFYGWEGKNGNRTFGFLNDPALLPAIASTSAGGWASGGTTAFQAIVADLRLMIITLRTQSEDNIDPEDVDITLVLPMNKVDMLSVVTDLGISVRDWLKQTYPRIRVMSAPELQGGNPDDGKDIAYMFLDSVDTAIDGSTDGGDTWAQLVQSKFITLGVEKRVKNYVEGYSNATAGVMLKRPWAVVRMIGI